MNKHSPKVGGICILLVVLVFVVFGQTLRNQFINFDDNQYVYENPVVSKGVSLQGLRWALFYGGIGHWHPLTWVTHMLDCQVFGMWAGGHHLTSVVLHATAVVVLFLVLFQMTGAMWRCAFVAAIWAAHPLRVESVAWVSERKDVLAAVFFTLTLGAYIRWVRQPSIRRYVLVVASFALGLLSKNMLVTLPCVLLLLDYWPLGRLNQVSRFPLLLKEKIPLFALSTLSCAITFLVPEKLNAADHLPLWLRIENAIVSYGIYLQQTFWPSGLAVYYPNPTHSFPWWQVSGTLILLCLISGVAIGLRKRFPSLLVGWLWFAGMLVPVIGLVQISTYANADRYTYLPQIGLLVAGTWTMAEWAGNRRSRHVVLWCGAVLGLCALPVTAWNQTFYWRDSITLWTHTLGCTNNNPVAQQGRTEDAIAQYKEAMRINPAYAEAHGNLGSALFNQGRTQEAMKQYWEALKIKPAYAEADYNLGIALLQQGRTKEATGYFQEAIRLKPGFAEVHCYLGIALFQQGRTEEAITQYQEALRINPAYVEAHYNLGNALLRQGRTEESTGHFQEAIRLKPGFAEVHCNLGIALYQQGRTEEAIAQYQEALRINPDYAEAHCNLGIALFQQGQTQEAILHSQKAIDIQPAHTSIQNSLAWMLATAPQASLRNGAKAVQLAMQASESSNGKNPTFLRTLAAAYAEAGDFSNAGQTAQKALQLVEIQPNSKLADALRREIKLYKAGHPYEP